MSEKINAILMLEILGRPPEHITEALEGILKKLGEEKNVEVINKKVAEPKPLEGKDLFSSFAEIEIKVIDLKTLSTIIYSYMPSHIEIISPTELRVKNSDMDVFFNEMIRKMHQYDEIAKSILIEKQSLKKQIEELKKIEKDKDSESG